MYMRRGIAGIHSSVDHLTTMTLTEENVSEDRRRFRRCRERWQGP